MLAVTKKSPEAGFSTLSRGGSFLSGFIKGEPLLELARSGLACVGVPEDEQDRYVDRIVRNGTPEDAAAPLLMGTVTSESSQDKLTAKAWPALTPAQASRLILDGNLTSERAQELLLEKTPLAAELSYGLLKSGKVRSEKGQRVLAQKLFDESVKTEGIFRQISGRMAHKILMEGIVTSGLAQEMLCGMMVSTSDRDPEVQSKAVELLAKGNLSDDAQGLLSMLVSDPDAARALLALGTVTARIARSRLYDRTPKEERDTVLDLGVDGGNSGVRLGEKKASG